MYARSCGSNKEGSIADLNYRKSCLSKGDTKRMLLFVGPDNQGRLSLIRRTGLAWTQHFHEKAQIPPLTYAVGYAII